jgi:hypothetical protein
METQKADEKAIKDRNQARPLRETFQEKIVSNPTNHTNYFIGQIQGTTI